jgi:hypothetical protein
MSTKKSAPFKLGFFNGLTFGLGLATAFVIYQLLAPFLSIALIEVLSRLQ